jgi:hypothetical protein
MLMDLIRSMMIVLRSEWYLFTSSYRGSEGQRRRRKDRGDEKGRTEEAKDRG